VEIKVVRAGGAHRRYDKKNELHLGGVGRAGLRDLMEHIYGIVPGAREVTVEMTVWTGYAYWKVLDEASLLKFSKMEMRGPNGLPLTVSMSKQTREAREKKRKVDVRHGPPGLGVQQVRNAVREVVREELAGGGEDNPIRKQTRRALSDESKEGGVLTAAAVRAAASLQRGIRALEKAMQMQQAAQLMAVQHTNGGQSWQGYHAPYTTRDTEGEWRRSEEPDRRGGGTRSRQHSWGEGHQLGRDGGATQADLEAVIATLRTPGGPDALRRLANGQ
jgi:hypothetical protein